MLNSAQFCYNLHRSSTTKSSPFKLVLGVQPQTPVENDFQKLEERSPGAYRFAIENKAIWIGSRQLAQGKQMNVEISELEVKIIGFQCRWHGVAKTDSLNLEENCRENSSSRVGAEVWWDFLDKGESESYCV